MRIFKQSSIIPVLLFSIFFINQAFKKNENTKVTIAGTVRVHKPYCGGVYPTPEQEMGTFVPMQAEFHLVTESDTSRTSVMSFSADKNGHFEIKIEKGKYFIFTTNKMMPLKQFLHVNVSNDRYVYTLGEECLTKWYNTPDYILDTEKETHIDIIFYSACFTGINPCLNYNGPLPQ